MQVLPLAEEKMFFWQIKSIPSRDIQSRQDCSILDPKQQQTSDPPSHDSFQNACTIGPESFVYNYWTRPKNLFASNILQLKAFWVRLRKTLLCLRFRQNSRRLPALLALTFRKLRNFLPALPKFVVVDLESFSHTLIHDVMRFGSTFRSFLVTRTLFTKKLVGLPLSQDPHKIFVRQSLCLGQSANVPGRPIREAKTCLWGMQQGERKTKMETNSIDTQSCFFRADAAAFSCNLRSFLRLRRTVISSVGFSPSARPSPSGRSRRSASPMRSLMASFSSPTWVQKLERVWAKSQVPKLGTNSWRQNGFNAECFDSKSKGFGEKGKLNETVETDPIVTCGMMRVIEWGLGSDWRFRT